MKWNYETNLPLEGTFKRRGLYWDDFFLSGAHHNLTEETRGDVFSYSIIDACENLQDSDPMKAFFLDHRLDCFDFYMNSPTHWRNHTERISEEDILCRFYFCHCEEDVFDMVVDGAGSPMALFETFAQVTAKDEGDIIPYTASLPRLNRFLNYLKTHGREDIVGFLTFNKKSITTTDMKEGDSIVVIGKDGKKVTGIIRVLTRFAVEIKVMEPLECSAHQSFHEHCLAVKVADDWLATETGEEVAKTLLCELYRELISLVDNPSGVGAFISNYQTTRDAMIARLKTLTTRQLDEYLQIRNDLDELLWKMRAEAFPEIKTIHMNECFLKAYSDKYLDGSFILNTEIHCWSAN